MPNTGTTKPTGLLAALFALREINQELIVLYDQRRAQREVCSRGRPPRWKRRLQSSLRATQSAQVRTEQSIVKLGRDMGDIA